MVTYWASKDDSDTLFQSYTHAQNDSCTGKIFIVKFFVTGKKWDQLPINWIPVKCIPICMLIPTYGFVCKYIMSGSIHMHKNELVTMIASWGWKWDRKRTYFSL